MAPMSRELVDPASVGVDPEEVAILMRRARLTQERTNIAAVNFQFTEENIPWIA